MLRELRLQVTRVEVVEVMARVEVVEVVEVEEVMARVEVVEVPLVVVLQIYGVVLGTPCKGLRVDFDGS